jgi:hypothetical protein
VQEQGTVSKRARKHARVCQFTVDLSLCAVDEKPQHTWRKFCRTCGIVGNQASEAEVLKCAQKSKELCAAALVRGCPSSDTDCTVPNPTAINVTHLLQALQVIHSIAHEGQQGC